MNISKIAATSGYYSNTAIHKTNQNITFQGSKQTLANKTAEKAKDAAGCLLPFAVLILTAPVLLISGLFSIGKKSKIEQSIYDMEREYSQHTGNFEFFKASHKKAEKLLDKYGQNNNYSEFVKEAMTFLHSRFDSISGCSEFERLEPFKNKNFSRKFGFMKFMQTVKTAARAAVSKNNKGIDIEKLDKDIQAAKEIIQQKK